MGNSYGASPAIWDHTVLPATQHRWTCPALTPAKQAGTRFTYPGGMEGWVNLVPHDKNYCYHYQYGPNSRINMQHSYCATVKLSDMKNSNFIDPELNNKLLQVIRRRHKPRWCRTLGRTSSSDCCARRWYSVCASSNWNTIRNSHQCTYSVNA